MPVRTDATLLQSWGPVLGLAVAWVWTVMAGGGGLYLLMTKGPWPLTNGWFALFSGLSACPLTAWAANRFGRIEISGRVRFVAAALLFVAGHIALMIESAVH